ncbi:MAG: hypothetical protein A2W23_02870 [Planctomycetes bacterium RBG_16_43_13]|nr:MAG: hypothetical protein A2W23_02870 [Planctomycetes bacterium RBG_16_43_13]
MNTERDQILLEIASALSGSSLTFFIGTGFSKFLTKNRAPSWKSLLAKCAEKIDESTSKELFEYKNGKLVDCKYDLTICAQMLEELFKLSNEDIRKTISSIIKKSTTQKNLDIKRTKRIKDFFERFPGFNIITTNYDDIISTHLLKDSRVYVEGSLLPKISDIKSIYHIHGSITKPESLIVTHDDYFKFQHRESYISRKLFTLLQETTTVILGYSLQDFNLNRILNEAKYYKGDRKRSDIFYISLNAVDDLSKRYYFSAYGIQVLDDLGIDEFFDAVEDKMDEADDIVRGAKKLPNILRGEKEYTDNFLKLGKSFINILMRLQTAGYHLNNKMVQNLLIAVIQRKKGFTHVSDAWSQYAHLAEWLIELGSTLEICGTVIEQIYKDLLIYSFQTMGSRRSKGQSWEAYDIWMTQVGRLTKANKKVVKEIITKQFPYVSARNLLPFLET